MKYSPGNIPLSIQQALRSFLAEELRRIANAIGSAEYVQLTPIDAEPAKRSKGLLVWAVGVNWDPGAGEGAYVYNGTTWDKVN